MNEPNNDGENKPNKDERRADIRVGYQAAVDLDIKEEHLFWTQFNAILVANSIFITAISFIICKNCTDLKDQFPELLEFMAIIGMTLCILWFLLTKRRLSYRMYYLFSAKDLERELYSVRTILRGRDFSDGNPVGFRTVPQNEQGEYELLQLPFFGRMKINCWSYLVISIFFLVYLYLFIKSIEYSRMELILIMVFVLICLLISCVCRGGNLKKKKFTVKLDSEKFDRLINIQREEDCDTQSKTIEFLIDHYFSSKEKD